MLPFLFTFSHVPHSLISGFNSCRVLTSSSGSRVNKDTSGLEDVLYALLSVIFPTETLLTLSTFITFCLFYTSLCLSRFLFPSLLFNLIGHTRNASDSFLRKLHPLPVCVPPHVPPSPSFSSSSPPPPRAGRNLPGVC